MDNFVLVQKSLELIQKDLGIAENIDLQSIDPEEALHHLLTQQIRYLLDNDFQFLVNAMYRVDIAEGEFKEIINLSKPEKVASDLAKAIIVREKQKVLTRVKYH